MAARTSASGDRSVMISEPIVAEVLVTVIGTCSPRNQAHEPVTHGAERARCRSISRVIQSAWRSANANPPESDAPRGTVSRSPPSGATRTTYRRASRWRAIVTGMVWPAILNWRTRGTFDGSDHGSLICTSHGNPEGRAL